MEFITPEQLKTHIDTAAIQQISKGDEGSVIDAINAAIGEAKGYLSRYHTEWLFHNPDNDPDYKKDPTLFNYVKNIAKWHFIQIANTTIDYDIALTSYEKAIAWLKDIQSGKVVQVNWKPAPVQEHSTFFHYNSNPKRRNHY